jgi:hypothetical protein
MANTILNATTVVETDLAILRRNLVLGALVSRDASAQFAGKRGDTVTIRVTGKARARRRNLRNGPPIITDEIHEFGVAVRLTDHIYSSIAITDDQLTLDIRDFAKQISRPQVEAVSENLEDLLVERAISTADYLETIEVDPNAPEKAFTKANKFLNDQKVSKVGRVLAVGSELERIFLDAKLFQEADKAGTTVTQTDAILGRKFGFTVVPSNGLDENFGAGFTKDAFYLVTRAPEVPDGASWGESLAGDNGLALRHLKDYDYVNTRDRSLVDVFAGAGIIEDPVDSTDPDSETQFVRGVRLVGPDYDGS